MKKAISKILSDSYSHKKFAIFKIRKRRPEKGCKKRLDTTI
uniref:Uncharacterized protein n=1 Tax=Chlamydia pneumoniae TaxID=83558 RepID=A0A0F7WUD7_CHLPN|nr:Uncharacterized protein BN1224_H12_DY_00480 [Chlamydia pneumoniae]